MKKQERMKLINDRCDILRDLGFQICHTDSRVALLDTLTIETNFDQLEVNFIGVKEEDFIKHAIIQAYKKGLRAGEKQTKREFLDFIDIESYLEN